MKKKFYHSHNSIIKNNKKNKTCEQFKVIKISKDVLFKFLKLAEINKKQ